MQLQCSRPAKRRALRPQRESGRDAWRSSYPHHAVALGIALVQREGGAAEAIASADAVVPDILDAFELLRNPKRLVATLRS